VQTAFDGNVTTVSIIQCEAKNADRKKGVGMRVFIGTSHNIDEIAARAKGAGIRLDREPHDTEWKSRAFGVTDPSGFLADDFKRIVITVRFRRISGAREST
jgi:uncharacterized glyoxalase superfamily protein PhnB